MSESTRRILVIKLGALGDFVQALNAFAFIRRHHGSDRIVLLTTPPFADLARESRLFDDIQLDARPKAYQVFQWLALRRFLRQGRFARVYDLQTSDRSSFYYRLFAPGPYPEWSGIAPACSHPHANPKRDFLHTLDRQAEQLRMAGIVAAEARVPDVSFLQADVSRFGLGPPYALLVPGGAPHRPRKRWPLERFAAIATELAGRGIAPVLLGVAAESPLTGRICELSPAAIAAQMKDRAPETPPGLMDLAPARPAAIDLAGRTGFADIAALARKAACALGNDTGPMHLIAATGCPSVVLFSAESEPALCAPRGPRVTVLRRDPLAALDPGEVLGALRALGVVS